MLAFGFTDKQIWVSTNVDVAQVPNLTPSIFDKHALLVGQRWFDLEWAKSVQFRFPEKIVREDRLRLQDGNTVGKLLFSAAVDQPGEVNSISVLS